LMVRSMIRSMCMCSWLRGSSRYISDSTTGMVVLAGALVKGRGRWQYGHLDIQ
jgi:hypothetical protein